MKAWGCIPTRDGVPNFHVASRLSSACRRVGATWGHTIGHLSVCTARNQAVALAKGQPGVTHLFMCDNDTFIPEDAIERLLRLDTAIATGVTPTTYRNGRGPAIPCINVAQWVNEDLQPQFYTGWFRGVREAKYCGASCILIRLDVFDAIGFPWWSHDETWDGRKYTCFSEDLTFCRRARELGFTILADGDLRCQHDRKVECSTLIPDDLPSAELTAQGQEAACP